jgi:WD40 repeat protein
VAAAWWYARPSAGAVVGVFDLGGGTLDTALLRANDEGYRVAGPPGGDANLGGEDFDELLLDQVMRVARDRDQELWSEVFTAAGPRARRDMALLRADVTMAKETLSEHLTFDLSVAGYAEEFRLTRAEFEELIGAAVDGATEEMIRTITGADASPGDLTGLFLTGGSSRIPLIAGRLADKLGLQPQLRDDPKAVVALGALTAVAEGRPAAKNTGTKTSPAPPHTATTPSRLTRTIAINTASVNYTLGRVAFSPDGSLLAAAVSGVAWLWRPSTGECVGEMRSAMTSGAVAFSPDGDRLAAGACLWSVPAGSLQHVLEAGPVERLPVKRKFGGRVVGGGLVPWVSDVSFSPDGRLLVTAGAPNPQVPGVLRIWDPASGELVRTFGSGYDEAVAFSPDGQLLAVISGEYYSGRVTDRGKNVQLWDVQSGALIRTFTTEYTGQRAKSLAFSPAGNLVAVSETFARISLYDVADGKRVRELRNYYADIGQKEPFRSGALAFSPDGRLLATAEYQWPGGRVKLWEVESGRAVAVLRGQEAYIKGLAFSPDGRMLAMVVLSTHGTLPPQHHGVVQVFE